MAIISRYASCHGPLAPNSERRIVATKFAVISPKCRSRLAASGTKLPFRELRYQEGVNGFELQMVMLLQAAPSRQ
jgi:hypothetical protein